MRHKIIVMQGPPASGKSYEARKIYDSHPNKYVIVSRDNIRDSRGKYWVPDQEDYISEVEEFSVKAALENDLIPILDSTNLNSNTIKKWEDIAKEYDAEIEYKPLYVPFKTALERDSKRDRPVGKSVLKRFYLKYFPEEYAKEMWTVNLDGINYFDKVKRGALVFDLDGTLAYSQGRNPFDWDKLLTDIPDPRIKFFIDALWFPNCFDIVFLTGRNEAARENTVKWLEKNFKIINPVCGEVYPMYKLYMRKDGDYRPGTEVKPEILLNEVVPNHNILMIFDDDEEVCKKYRELGFYVCQVNNFE